MRTSTALLLLSAILPCAAAAQPADCPAEPPVSALPLGLNIGGLPGAPLGLTGQAYVAVPMAPASGMTCANPRPPPRDVLRGEPGDLLRGPEE